MSKYKNPVCRGVWALNNNCKTCERCIETRPKSEHKPEEPRGFIKSLVDRFLGWKLPLGVNPDPYPPGHIHESCNSGTNLLSATEAQQMFEYLFPFDPETNSATGWMVKYERLKSAYDQLIEKYKEQDDRWRKSMDQYTEAYDALKKELDELKAKQTEIIYYMPKVPTQPYEKELAQRLVEANADIEQLKQELNESALNYMSAVGQIQTALEERDAAKAERDELKFTHIPEAQGTIEQLEKQLAEAQREIERLNQRLVSEENDYLRLIGERDHREEQIDEIADALGDQTEWTSANDRGVNALELAHAGHALIEKLAGALDQATRQWEVYVTEAAQDDLVNLDYAEAQELKRCKLELLDYKEWKK